MFLPGEFLHPFAAAWPYIAQMPLAVTKNRRVAEHPADVRRRGVPRLVDPS
jgi:hypothetical protein